MSPFKAPVLLLALVAALSGSCSEPPSHPIDIQERDGVYVVTVDGVLFTQYIHGEQKPYLYPVIGPTGLNMTREFPMKEGVAGESQDHPWHRSVYYTHGSVNGLDFWNEKSEEQQSARIELAEVQEAKQLPGGKARIIARHKWTHRGETVMTDRTEIVFSADESKRVIDYTVVLIASEGDVALGDTKEGCMAVRMHHKFRVKDQGALVVNSEGDTGKAVWGKSARWIAYSNHIDGEKLGISLLDHPDNLRYPSTWHARDYGLCAANPFGLKFFQPESGITGDLLLKKGESLSFSYRLVFHKGGPEEIGIDQLHTDWAQR